MRESIYMRATVYIPTQDKSFIFDAYGMFDAVWKFTEYLLDKGCEIIAVGDDETFIDCNCGMDTPLDGKMHIISQQEGKPKQFEERYHDNRIYNAVMVGRCGYIPNRNHSIDGGNA